MVCLGLACMTACAGDARLDTGSPVAPGTTEQPYLLDSDGSVVIYRGVSVNNAAKGSEDHLPHLEDGEVDLIRSSGFTLIRLLIFWEAIEPRQGSYDQDYLQGLDQLLATFDELGVDVMLDMHQDLWGEGFGATGAPYWSCDESNYESYQVSGEYWWLGYLTEEMAACFNAFWQDTTLWQHYAASWAQVVDLALDHDCVVGYDLMNEPFFGDYDQETMETQILPDFYSMVTGIIREVDQQVCDSGRPCRFVALEPSLHTNLQFQTMLEFPEGEVQLFAPHFYPPYAEMGTGYDGDFTDEQEDLRGLAEHAVERGRPTLIGEYGIFSSLGNEQDYIRAVQDSLESLGGGTAYWSYDRSDSYGLVDSQGQAGYMMSAFYRPYIHKIPGILQELEPLEDGMRVTYQPVGQAPLVAVVPEVCNQTVLSGAELVREDGPRWELSPEPGSDGPVTVQISGCSTP